MLCSNCGKNEANVRYTRIINGEKTEYNLCEDCAKKLGIDDIDFNMPINFSNFLSDFFDDEALLPSFTKTLNNKCPGCGLTYEEFAKNGRFGCGECYSTFANKIEAVLKNLHGTSKHKGRCPKKLLANNEVNKEKNKEVASQDKSIDEKALRIDKLNEEIKQAIKEERYEDAAKIRDEIKKING